MKSLFKKRNLLIGLLLIAVVASSVFVLSIQTRAEEYNETNPEFSEARINSDVELQYGVKNAYMQTTSFSQNGDTYGIDTDAFVAWYTTDDIAMLYRQYKVGNTSDDRLTIECTVQSQTPLNAGTSLYSTASSGIMMRGSVKDSESGFASVYLHTRATGVDIVYRPNNGEQTYHVSSGVVPQYPVTLRMEKVGKAYACYFKNANMSSFKLIAKVGANITGAVYGGIASHCSDVKAPISSVFKNYTAVGVGTLDIPDDSGLSSSGPEKIDVEDPPMTDKTLLQETFTDGSMTDGEEAINNPIWTDPEGEIVTDEGKTNRRWYQAFSDSTAPIGSQYWTDYSVSMDYEIADGVSDMGDDKLILWTRHKDIDPYGYYGVGFSIETKVSLDSDGNTTVTPVLVVYRRYRNGAKIIGSVQQTVEIPKMIGTGVHNIKVDCLDNTFTVYIDGNLITTYADENTSPCLRGCIAIQTQEIECYLDNIIVTKIDDPHGGDYDNYIGANYNEDIPDYIKDFQSKTEITY